MLSTKFIFVALFVEFLLVDLGPLVLESSMVLQQTLYILAEIKAASRLTSSSKLV